MRLSFCLLTQSNERDDYAAVSAKEFLKNCVLFGPICPSKNNNLCLTQTTYIEIILGLSKKRNRIYKLIIDILENH
jgi:hypothetical protein